MKPQAYAQKLLRQAARLEAGTPSRRGSEADLRRSCSASYYALFHFLIGEATDLMIPRGSNIARPYFRRCFGHGQMRSVAEIFKSASHVSRDTILSEKVKPAMRTPVAELHKALDRALEAYAENDGSLEVESRQNVTLLGKNVVVSIVISHPDTAVVLRTT